MIQASRVYYSDDTVILANDKNTLNENVKIYRKALERRNIQPEEVGTMLVEKGAEQHTIQLEGERLFQVQEFKYLI